MTRVLMPEDSPETARPAGASASDNDAAVAPEPHAAHAPAAALQPGSPGASPSTLSAPLSTISESVTQSPPASLSGTLTIRVVEAKDLIEPEFEGLGGHPGVYCTAFVDGRVCGRATHAPPAQSAPSTSERRDDLVLQTKPMGLLQTPYWDEETSVEVVDALSLTFTCYCKNDTNLSVKTATGSFDLAAMAEREDDEDLREDGRRDLWVELHPEGQLHILLTFERSHRAHRFQVTTKRKPGSCDACQQLMWGKILKCGTCRFRCHMRCEKIAPRSCKKSSDVEVQESRYAVLISSIKLRSISLTAIPTSVSVVLNFDGFVMNSESVRRSADIAFEFDKSFYYNAPADTLSERRLTVRVLSNGKEVIGSVEIDLESLLVGPVHNDFQLLVGSRPAGRVSFNLQIEEVRMMSLTVGHIQCKLQSLTPNDYYLKGRYSGTEGDHISFRTAVCPDTREPAWAIETVGVLRVSGTLRELLGSTVWLRLYHVMEGGQEEMAGECFLSVDKYFQAESQMVAFNERLTRSGRNTGTIQGTLRLDNLPKKAQMAAGVRLDEKTIAPAGSVILGDKSAALTKKVSKSSLPSEVQELGDLFGNLQKLQRKEKGAKQTSVEDILARMHALLRASHKQSMISFLYQDRPAIAFAARLFLELWAYLLEYADAAQYQARLKYYLTIGAIMRRGELDISSGAADPELAMTYREQLYRTVGYAATKLNRASSFDAQRDFAVRVLAQAYFHLPELRKRLVDALPALSKQAQEDTSPVGPSHGLEILDWNTLNAQLLAQCTANKGVDLAKKYLPEDEGWIQRLAKRGQLYFMFVEAVIRHVHSNVVIKDAFDWRAVPGFTILADGAVCALRVRPLTELPDSLLACLDALCLSGPMFGTLVRVAFRRTSVYNVANVSVTMQMLDRWLRVRAECGGFPTDFDSGFFFRGLTMLLESDHSEIVCNAIVLLYRHYEMFRGRKKQVLFGAIVLERNFQRLFLHYDLHVRRAFHVLLVYKILPNAHTGEDAGGAGEKGGTGSNAGTPTRAPNAAQGGSNSGVGVGDPLNSSQGRDSSMFSAASMSRDAQGRRTMTNQTKQQRQAALDRALALSYRGAVQSARNQVPPNLLVYARKSLADFDALQGTATKGQAPPPLELEFNTYVAEVADRSENW